MRGDQANFTPHTVLRDPHYFTRVRRRWIKTISTITNSTPATTRTIVVVSMSKSPFVKLFEQGAE